MAYPSGQVQDKHRPRLAVINPMHLPSMTTAAFAMIAILTVKLLFDTGSLSIANIGGLLMSALIVLGSLRLYASLPQRLIQKYAMIPLESVDPDTANRMAGLARAHGVRVPDLLYTEDPRVLLQTFGAFRRSYIVVSKIELDAVRDTRRFGDLDTMVLHELGHEAHGDLWKLQYVKLLLQTFRAFMLLFAVIGATSSYSVMLLQMSGPGGKAAYVFAFASYFLIIAVLQSLLTGLQDVRECYADALALHWLGTEQGPARLISALWLAAHARASVAPSWTREKPPLVARVIGFASAWRTGDVRRETAIVESASLGAPFLSSMRRVVFAGGMAVGTQMFAPDSDGLLWTVLGFGFGGGYLGVTYLLSVIASRRVDRRDGLAMAATVTAVFSAGVLAFWLARAVLLVAVFQLFGAGWTSVSHDIGILAARTVGLLGCGAALVTALAVTPGLIRKQAAPKAQRHSRAVRLALLAGPVAYVWSTFATFMLLASALARWIAEGRPITNKSLVLLAILTFLGIAVRLIIAKLGADGVGGPIIHPQEG